jgi:hypothetical protein
VLRINTDLYADLALKRFNINHETYRTI